MTRLLPFLLTLGLVAAPNVLVLGGAGKGSIRVPDGVAFPPPGHAYRENAESFRLWRQLLLQAPDLVVLADERLRNLRPALEAAGIPVQWGSQRATAHVAPSAAHQALLARLRRTPLDVARQLGAVYGRQFPDAVYVPGMAVIGRMRLGDVADAERMVAPFVNGEKDSLGKATASHFAGHLVFAELAERTSKPQYAELVKKAAAFVSLNPMDNEMSDSIFMVCPLLARAGKYAEARAHFRKMKSLCQRADGLYRHSPLSEAAWGRGNAFPALGLALTLEHTPENEPAFTELLNAFQELVARLAPMQDQSNGMWHQVIDMPESYSEFSATAMIGRAMLIGVRHGWLPRSRYQPAVDAAWKAISTRTFSDGQVAEVCESTGKQTSVKDYLLRESIWGIDHRGGGMAMQFALDLAAVR